MFSRGNGTRVTGRRFVGEIYARGSHVQDEASYTCDACGEEIVIPLDLSAGESQEYVEDCPVCCRPNLVHVEIEENGEVRVWAEAE
jgi:hypothetical protein